MNRVAIDKLQTLPFIPLYGKVGKCYPRKATGGSSMMHPFQSLKTANLPPRRQKNVDRRVREYLSHREVEELRKTARKNTRHGLRNDTLILMMFRHGLRVSEIASLKWQQVDLKIGLLHVKRLKKGIPSTHPLRGLELRALRQLARDYPDSPYIFVSERRSPLSPRTNFIY
jgi:integrase